MGKNLSRVAALLLLALSTGLHAETYYIDDGTSIRDVSGDPAELNIKVEEWQIRIYKAGQPTGGRDNWGLITGSSAASVTKQLLDSQKFEKRYAKFFGIEPDQKWWNTTGPIAVLEKSKQIIPRLGAKGMQIIDAIQGVREKINEIREPYETAKQIADSEEEAKKPGIGSALKEYLENLKAAHDRAMDLEEKMSSFLAPSENEIMSALDKVTRDLAKADAGYSKFKTATAPIASDPESSKKLLKVADGATAKSLIQSGGDPNVTDPKYGYNALMMAARNNRLDVVKELLANGADVNRKANDGYTALMFAANCGDPGVEIVKLLLEKGADVNARQNDGHSALSIVKGGHAESIENALKAAGAR